MAAGVRRVEAVTGDVALAYMQDMETALGGVAGTLKVLPGEVHARVTSILESGAFPRAGDGRAEKQAGGSAR